jgi:recombination protein RecA
MLAAATRRGDWAAWIDGDHSFSARYAQACGVALDRLALAQPPDLEAALEMLDRLVASAACGLIVLDGLDFLPSRHPDLQTDWYADDAYAHQPVSMSLRRTLQSLTRQPGALVITHSGHSPADRGALYHDLHENLTRLSLPLLARTRLLVSGGPTIQAGGHIIGQQAHLFVIKNPTKPYHQTLTFDIMYSQGVRRSSEVFDLALRLGIIRKTGDGYACEQSFLGPTRQTVIDLFNGCVPPHPVEQALRHRLLLE